MPISIPGSGIVDMKKNTSGIFSDFFYMLGKNKSALVGLVIIIALVIIALLAPFLSPNNPLQRSLANRLKPGFWAGEEYAQFPLGTDYLGRCLLSRIIWGARTSLSVGFIAVLISTVFLSLIHISEPTRPY